MRIIIVFIFILFSLISSCTSMSTPVIVSIPRLPINIGEYDKINTHDECPNLSGLFNRVPLGFKIQKSGGIINNELSNKFSYLSLFQLGKKKSQVSKTIMNDPVLIDKILIKHENKVITLLTKHLKKQSFLTESLSHSNGDFKCENGLVVLKESSFKGGGDGTWINFRSIRTVGRLKNKDIIIYEQIAYTDRNEHNYFIYQLQKSQH